MKRAAAKNSFTDLALKNFQISGIRAPRIFMESLGLVKLAATQSNARLKLLKPRQAKAIIKACHDFIAGKFSTEFIIDVFQAGAGTSYNMNANEIIANRASRTAKTQIHPNDHVNMSQSTNDVIPTATRIAALLSLPALLRELYALEQAISKKAATYEKITKVGRTHGQDAVPITFGQEFDSYKEALKKSREFIAERSLDLQILGIGGTAVGTGINANPRYQKLMLKNLSQLTGIQFYPAKNLTETTNNMNTFLNFSAALRSLAVNLLNFCNDLKLLASGPKAGLAEITLPTVQPGSSIMPGKVNPSIPECTEMICLQILGNDHTIAAAAQKSQLELNVFCPIIMYNLLQSTEILTNGLSTLRRLCIQGLRVNTARIRQLFENSLCTATALAPHLGYTLTAEIVKAALKKNITIKEEVKARGLS